MPFALLDVVTGWGMRGSRSQVKTKQVYSDDHQMSVARGVTLPYDISHDACVDSYKGLWAFTYGFKRFSGLQSSLGITNGNRSHNKPLELI